ncbi:MAG: TolB family protein [Bryobacteraceae bacterium]
MVRLNADWLPLGEPRLLTEQAAAIYGIAWSPDGRSLVYSAGHQGAQFLLRVDEAGGTAPQRLEIASQGAYYPAIAHKANRLAFSRAMINADVWRMHAGGRPEPFLISTAADMNAQFSPDGRRIAFASSRSAERTAIWLANADGTGLTPLTRDLEEFHGSPRWSPDGRWIAFDAQGKDGRWNVRLVESGGGQSRLLTDGPFNSVVPAWSRDGKWIYFGSDRTGRFEIWRVPFEGGAAGQITRNG